MRVRVGGYAGLIALTMAHAREQQPEQQREKQRPQPEGLGEVEPVRHAVPPPEKRTGRPVRMKLRASNSMAARATPSGQR